MLREPRVWAEKKLTSRDSVTAASGKMAIGSSSLLHSRQRSSPAAAQSCYSKLCIEGPMLPHLCFVCQGSRLMLVVARRKRLSRFWAVGFVLPEGELCLRMVPPAAAVATSGGAMVDLSQSCTGIAQSQMGYFTTASAPVHVPSQWEHEGCRHEGMIDDGGLSDIHKHKGLHRHGNCCELHGLLQVLRRPGNRKKIHAEQAPGEIPQAVSSTWRRRRAA